MIIPVGIDVSKDKLDLYFPDRAEYRTISNCSQEIHQVFNQLDSKRYKIIVEATGKYHRLCHRIAETYALEVTLVNPYQARNFARAMNIQCKTDKLDAQVLSQYGDSDPPSI